MEGRSKESVNLKVEQWREITQSERNREKRHNEQNLKDLWDNQKHLSLLSSESQERGNKMKRKKYFKK